MQTFLERDLKTKFEKIYFLLFKFLVRNDSDCMLSAVISFVELNFVLPLVVEKNVRVGY